MDLIVRGGTLVTADGFEVRGWPKWTISRGDVVQADGRVTGVKGRARLVRRGPHRAI